ncbi:MAG: DUF3524 domain-containing protein [Acidobacteriota bacterium]|nr:DUF3524 domain-containing protein [Acidobacteriota bacterium]
MSVTRSIDAVFVESFAGGSHEAFAEGWLARSRHRWRRLGLPAERWKWRLRAGALALAPRLGALDPPPRAVVATSLVDLAHLRALSGLDRRRRPPAFLLYMHENQLTYPRPPGEPLDRSFAGAHLASWLAADALAWNSRSHRDAALAATRDYLEQIPPPRPRGLLRRLRASRILPPGVDLGVFPAPASRPVGSPPVIAWNHRWDGDKRPGAFARVLLRLADKGLDFRLVLLGPVVQVEIAALALIRERLGDRILRDGPARSRREYAAWLGRADIAVSTAGQENFGYAAVEAMAAGAVPLFPRRLSYPELLTPSLRDALLYGTDRELAARLGRWLARPALFAGLRRRVMLCARRHDWARRAAALDRWVGQEAS